MYGNQQVSMLIGIKQTLGSEKFGKSFNMLNEYFTNKSEPSLEVLNKAEEITVEDGWLLIQTNKGK